MNRVRRWWQGPRQWPLRGRSPALADLGTATVHVVIRGNRIVSVKYR